MRTTKELYAMLEVVTEAMYGGASQEPDYIDFSWWNNEQLHDFINDYAKVELLNEDDFEALVMEVANRVGAKIGYNEDREGFNSAD